MLQSFLFIYLSFQMVLAGSSHKHDEAQVQMAYDSGKGKIIVHLPADLVIGFEHSPRNPKEAKLAEEKLSQLNTQAKNWFSYETSDICEWQAPTNEWIKDKTHHSEVKVTISFNCKKSPVGENLKVRLKENFPRLKRIDFEVLIESFQRSWVLKEAVATLKLSP